MKYVNFDKINKQQPANLYLMDEAGQWERPKGKSLMIGRIYIHWEKGAFWFRIFGIGINGVKRSRRLFFSERNGYAKNIIIGDWSFRLLK